MQLGFQPAPVLLGFVLGKQFEETFRRAVTISHYDMSVFVTRPISALFLSLCLVLVGSQIYLTFRKKAGSGLLAAMPSGDLE